MATDRSYRLGDLTSPELAAILGEGAPVVALLPVGSVEPHGPHLPLSTDTLLSQGAAERSVALLAAKGVRALVCPSVPFGVTDFASGFAGAVSLPHAALTAFLVELARALHTAGFAHVCLVNNHLEPAHDAAIRGVVSAFDVGLVSVACPLERRHARTLSAEFKSGACHAGEYETSMVMALAPELVRDDVRSGLGPVAVSLSDGIRAGKTTFRAMGMDEAYAGAPASATAEHGAAQLDLLATMITTEVTEALSKRADP